VQHEAVFVLAGQRVDALRVALGAQRGHHQRLGFAAGEQRRAVGARQHAVADLDGAHGAGVAAVDARLAGRSADRAIERNAGDSQGSRGTDHRSDVRIGLFAGGDDGADNLHFVHEAFWEQRTDRTVDQSGSQGFFLGRTAFALEETARDLTGSVSLFLVVNRQREEALAWVCSLGAYNGHQYGNVVVNGNQHCAGGLTGDTACLEGNGRLTELKFFDNRVHGVLPSLWLLGNLSSCEILGQCRESAQPLSRGKTCIQIKLEAGSLPWASGNPTDTRQTTNL
jgi:hypothetical protein